MNYLYNGVELPELPDFTIDNPTLMIGYDQDGSYYIGAYISTTDKVNNTDGIGTQYVGVNIPSYKNVGNAWEPNSKLTIITVTWSNKDLYFSNGTLWLSASDPIPVLSLTERDLYRKINGQPTKLTLYKKVGGKLVALDEYTQGGNL